MKTKKPVSLQDMVQVPEHIVRSAWDAVDNEKDSGFGIVLLAAEEFKAANMTPIFILDKTNMDIMVVAQETFGKLLH